MIASNQPMGLKRQKAIKTFTFTKKEFNKDLVPDYAFNLIEKDDQVSFQCAFDSFGNPVYKTK